LNAVEAVRSRLDYEPDTGLFRWRGTVNKNKKIRAGDIAGTGRSDGYITIGVAGTQYLAHRLVWLYVHGFLPPNDVDHIDGDRKNNRLGNLRLATRSENHQNRHVARSNSGRIGVSYCAREQKWRAYINVGGKMKSLGYHASSDDASRAYLAAKAVYHPFVFGAQSCGG
jgi:hypothetical protein